MTKLLIVLGFIISINASAQSDSVTYQYRISVKDITSKGSSSLIQEPLKDLFKATPTYQEPIETFVFESHEDVYENDVNKVLTNYTIIQFKKLKVKQLIKQYD